MISTDLLLRHTCIYMLILVVYMYNTVLYCNSAIQYRVLYKTYKNRPMTLATDDSHSVSVDWPDINSPHTYCSLTEEGGVCVYVCVCVCVCVRGRKRKGGGGGI